MSRFQNKATGEIISFPDEITISEALIKFPSLPDTLSVDIIPYPGNGYIWEIDKWIFDEMKQKSFLKKLALVELGKSDTTILRFYESSILVTEDWITYRKKLRDIVSGIDVVSLVLPIKPEYVIGT